MIELRLGNVIAIGLAAMLFFIVAKFALTRVGGSAGNTLAQMF